MKKLFFLLLILTFMTPLVGANENEDEWISQEDLAVYHSFSEEQCLNILVVSDRGSFYNGLPLPANARNFHIAGDRLAYSLPSGVVAHIIVDGEDYGEVSSDVVINENHFAFLKQIGTSPRPNSSPNAPPILIFHVIMDGADLGEAADITSLHLNGDYVLYRRWFPEKQKFHVFVNGQDFGEGLALDYDGENFAVMRSDNFVLYLNGKRIAELGESGGFRGSFSVKDGHFAYNRGSNLNAHIIYDGQDVGRGVVPMVEVDHLAYHRFYLDRPGASLIYDRQDFGEMGGSENRLSLAGDHFAFMRKESSQVSRVNVDGIDQPGQFTGNVYVEIAERPDCSAPNPNMIEGFIDRIEGPCSIEEPVCGAARDGSGLLTYQNRCMAEINGATNITEGSCGQSSFQSPAEKTEKKVSIPPAGFEEEVITAFEIYENPFSDTKIKNLEGKAAFELYRRAVLGGYPDGEFKGSRFVNRAEAAKFLIQSHFGNTEETGGNNEFPDVLPGEWYVKFVIKAAQKGIIQGYPDGRFKPADTVNTAEFLKMLTKTFVLSENLPYHYLDVNSDVWYAKYAGIAQKYDLFPHRENRLQPARLLTRNEVAVAIYQYLSNR